MALTTVKAAGIAADSIDETKIADNGIDSEHYNDGSIDHAHLANDCIDGDNLADNAVDSEHYTDGSIDHAHLANDCVDGDNIADNSVTLAHMAGGTDGQIITYDASGDPLAVGPGTDGQVLTSTGAGSPPAFETINTNSGLPCFFATNESSGNWPASATPSRLDFSTTREDSATDFSETAKFTPTTSGYYYVWCQVTMRFLDAAHAMQLYIYKNGSATGAMTYTNGRNSDYHNWINQTVHGIVQCNGSSDYLEAYLANIPDSGTTTVTIQHRNFGAFRLGAT